MIIFIHGYYNFDLCDIQTHDFAAHFSRDNASDSTGICSRLNTRASTPRARRECGGCVSNSRNPDSAKARQRCQSAAPFWPPHGLKKNEDTRKKTSLTTCRSKHLLMCSIQTFSFTAGTLCLRGHNKINQSIVSSRDGHWANIILVWTGQGLFFKKFSTGGILSCES